MMNDSDFAIITPSVVLYEAMFLKLPFISIKTADNQEIMRQYLFENNHPVFKGDELNELSREIQKHV
jgi:spore coat polysaccharide biosynthesis predicted glycosyltransferase SpsG